MKKLKNFSFFLRQNKIKEEIVKDENNNSFKNNENKMKIILSAYTLLLNIFNMFDYYLNTLSTIKNNFNKNEENSFDDHKNLFETYKNFPLLHKNIIIDQFELSNFVKFYIKVIEKKQNYDGCIKIINNCNQINKTTQKNEIIFGTSNLTESKLEQICSSYLKDYYNTEDTKNKRIYKMENAGSNWTQEDIKRFNEGMRLYGHCQLANTKIAKYMGSHIETSHVKLFRSKISKEKRIKRKQEKEIKITEMKKKRNATWKPVTDCEN